MSQTADAPAVPSPNRSALTAHLSSVLVHLMMQPLQIEDLARLVSSCRLLR